MRKGTLLYQCFDLGRGTRKGYISVYIGEFASGQIGRPPATKRCQRAVSVVGTAAAPERYRICMMSYDGGVNYWDDCQMMYYRHTACAGAICCGLLVIPATGPSSGSVAHRGRG